MLPVNYAQFPIRRSVFEIMFLFARRILLCLSVLCWSHSAFAQFMPGTAIKYDSDTDVSIGVNPDDLNLKTDDGRAFATLQDYSAKLTILKGATVEIHRQGGLLDNIQWSKGKAKVNESFNIGGFSVAREITYSD